MICSQQARYSATPLFIRFAHVICSLCSRYSAYAVICSLRSRYSAYAVICSLRSRYSLRVIRAAHVTTELLSNIN